jgi:hypothetical protein
MATYHASPIGNRTFSLKMANTLNGQLKYLDCMFMKSSIALSDNSTFKVESRNFWKTCIDITKDGEKILSYKMEWNGTIVLCLYSSYQVFKLKTKNIFSTTFKLTDNNGSELMEIKPCYKWNKLDFEFKANSSENFERLSQKELLIFASIHAIKAYMNMIITAGVS